MSTYLKQAVDFLNATSTSFKANFWKHDFYFVGDKDSRDIYKITLKNKLGSYTFTFGQSISNQGTPPTPYDVLASVTKYDPGTFENFCSEYGYDTDSRTAERTYKAVCKEWQNLNRLFSSEQIEAMTEIQ